MKRSGSWQLMMSETLKKVKESLPICEPPFWAFEGHLQSILGHLLPSKTLKETGEVIHIPVIHGPDKILSKYFKGEKPIVVYLFHGLGGSSDASYMHRTAIVARDLGLHVFMTNHRGCGEGAGMATGPYHSGRSEDLSVVISYGREKLSHCKHVAIGFSLSANALLLLISKHKDYVLPDAAIAVNAPINLDQTSQNLNIGLNQIYNQTFLRELKTYIKANRAKDLLLVKKAKTMRQFDEFLTAPICGFEDHLDYYEKCSAKKYLNLIEIPTVILTAKDDPFVNVNDYLESTLSPSTFLHIEEKGGHMGYLSKIGRRTYRWLDVVLKEYLKAIISP
jgi:predicted alpha/beta-fold hydrolase